MSGSRMRASESDGLATHDEQMEGFEMKVAVLGAGNGAHAMAADLSLAGHEVRMCELPQFEQNIMPVKVLGEYALPERLR